ncbi:hypothetical protein AL037_07545 [Salipiger aestuarii]|nr:hypothetical protein AL037_07545 [Salipiger aestuarii]
MTPSAGTHGPATRAGTFNAEPKDWRAGTDACFSHDKITHSGDRNAAEQNISSAVNPDARRKSE